MKRCFLIVILYFLVCTFSMAQEPNANPTLGKLTLSKQTFIIDQHELPLYQAFDTLYVPVYLLPYCGYTVDNNTLSQTIIISNTYNTPSNVNLSDLITDSLDTANFSLFEGELYVESFKTHGIIANGRVFIPLRALDHVGKITSTSNGYFYQHKDSLPITLSASTIENLSSDSLTVTLKDIYWDNTWVVQSHTYTLSANQVITLPSKDTTLKHISTYISSVYSPTLSYTAESYFGQLNTPLFTMYDRIKAFGDLTSLGDPLSIDEIIWAEDTLNSMNLSSSTPFLVWTHIPTQKTYVFKSENNQFKLIKHFISSTGRASSPTPTGTYKLTKKVPYFGVEKGYRCKNAFGFIGTTYLYHSVMYDKTGTYLLKGKGALGTPASGGCIRLSPENSEWFYNNLVSGTTVVITK